MLLAVVVAPRRIRDRCPQAFDRVAAMVENIEMPVEIPVRMVTPELVGGLAVDLGAGVVLIALVDEVHIAPVAFFLAEPVALGAGEVDGIGVERIKLDSTHELETRIAHFGNCPSPVPTDESGRSTGN